MTGTPADEAALGLPPDTRPEIPLSEFVKCAPTPLQTIVPKLDPVGIDLLGKMLELNPDKRIAANKAVEHPYFADAQPR
mgnify:CR=1 FL=1